MSGRNPSRVALGLLAFLLFVGYLGASALVYRGLTALWALRPDTPALALGALVFTLVFGYLSHRAGVAQLLSAVDARELDRARAPGLYERVETLADRLGTTTPTLAVTRLRTPNAFALAGGNGVVVIDTSLFDFLEREELLGVLAHELAHLRGHEGTVQVVAQGVLGTVVGVGALLALPVTLALKGTALATALLTDTPPDRTLAGRALAGVWGAISVVMVAGTLLLRARSRRREFAADARAVEATENPLALASALQKIERRSQGPWETLSPLYTRGGDESTLARLFDTHPDTEERVERLRRKAERGG